MRHGCRGPAGERPAPAQGERVPLVPANGGKRRWPWASSRANGGGGGGCRLVMPSLDGPMMLRGGPTLHTGGEVQDRGSYSVERIKAPGSQGLLNRHLPSSNPIFTHPLPPPFSRVRLRERFPDESLSQPRGGSLPLPPRARDTHLTLPVEALRLLTISYVRLQRRLHLPSGLLIPFRIPGTPTFRHISAIDDRSAVASGVETLETPPLGSESGRSW